ncbi:MAG: TetR/AcrR family transcriptional regulator [Firmicutes bacterium]|nr:TetR/AcrR family transcriptional regulator [Bacillota bacterium]
MKEPKRAKQVAKTEAALEKAYFSLMEEGKKITVGTLTEKSGINRATFYIHYKNIAAFAEKKEDDIVKKIYGLLTSGEGKSVSNYDKIYSCLEYLEKNKGIATELFTPGKYPSFTNKLKEKLTEKFIKDVFHAENSPLKDNYILVAHFFLEGAIGITASWLKEGSVSLQDIASLLDNIYSKSFKN